MFTKIYLSRRRNWVLERSDSSRSAGSGRRMTDLVATGLVGEGVEALRRLSVDHPGGQRRRNEIFRRRLFGETLQRRWRVRAQARFRTNCWENGKICCIGHHKCRPPVLLKLLSFFFFFLVPPSTNISSHFKKMGCSLWLLDYWTTG